MNRKKFLKNLGVGAVVAPFFSSTLISCNNDDDSNTGGANNTNCSTSATNADMLGPYYVSGTSEITNLNTQSLPGTSIIVSGTIYSDANNQTPVANAILEIWHADDGGIYHPVGDGNVANYQPNQITLRGFVVTDAQGRYTFQSIRPGLYPGRPRHFHYRITANGYQTLVTQIYFQDDQSTSNENIDSCRIIDFSMNAQNILQGTADIRLQAN